MTLQASTIDQYKTVYPNDKLKDIADKTKTQITRVFRILNGAEMKLCEYERFNQVINIKTNNDKLHYLVQDCIEKLNHNRKSELENTIHRLLKNEASSKFIEQNYLKTLKRNSN